MRSDRMGRSEELSRLWRPPCGSMTDGDGTKERIGFVGLGIMGVPMARNALRAGFTVTVTNRTIARAEPLRAEGAIVAATPREVAEVSDLVVTMVTSSAD